jgi:hypothetical protein
MCDPFFRYTYLPTLGGDLFGDEVYNPDVCTTGGLPQI